MIQFLTHNFTTIINNPPGAKYRKGLNVPGSIQLDHQKSREMFIVTWDCARKTRENGRPTTNSTFSTTNEWRHDAGKLFRCLFSIRINLFSIYTLSNNYIWCKTLLWSLMECFYFYISWQKRFPNMFSYFWEMFYLGESKIYNLLSALVIQY